MAPIRPYKKPSTFKERVTASGKKSKNVIDSRGDNLGMKAETKKIFQEMQTEKGMTTKGLPNKKGKNPAVTAGKDPTAVLRKMPGPSTKFQKGNSPVDSSKLSKKGPKPKA